MTDQCKIFEPIENPEQGELLAAHLPVGGVFDAAREEGSNFNDLILGLAVELYRTEVALYTVCAEMDPNETLALLPEWERSVGIPDDCFTTTVDLETRRQQLLLKLGGYRVQTAQDFINLAAIFDVVVEIEPGAIRGVYPQKYSVVYYPSAKDARFTMIVHFPDLGGEAYPIAYEVPYSLGVGGIVECLFTNVAPANVDVVFSYGTNAP